MSLKILSNGLPRFLLTVVTIVVTAITTWYINYRLSHLDPIIAVTNVNFFYDIKGEKELIEIPYSLIESDRKGFFGSGLKHFMTLEDLDRFTGGNRMEEIEKRYRLFETDLPPLFGPLLKLVFVVSVNT